MEYRKLGKSGVRVSDISLGTWLTYGKTVEKEIARNCFKVAFEQGINFFDTADIYAYGESEKVVGDILQDFNRSEIFLGTKVFFPMSQSINDRGLSRKHIMESCHTSLKRLKTDYIDLYQCHRYDSETPPEEFLAAMDDLVRQGKILYWGVSQWSALQICETVHLSRQLKKTAPQSNQPVYNLFNRSLEVDVMDLCEKEGMGLVVWSPLAQGILSGKYSGGKIPADSRAANDNANFFMKNKLTPAVLDKVEQLRPIAAELGLTLSQLALAWCLRKSAVSSVITGASKPEQVLENVKASGVKIPAEMLGRIEAIMANAPRDQYADFG